MRRGVAWLALALASLAGGGCSSVRVSAGPGAEARTLPLKEVPARPLPAGDSGGAAVAVVLTGDGPWRGLADRLAGDVARAGVPAVVWSSPRYYWTPRTPDEAAADLDLVIRWLLARTGRERVVLVGYSMGADVLPFLVNRLPPETRARIGGVALVALAHDAVFEFRLEQWFTRSTAPSRATRPELEKLRDLRVLCVWGRGDRLAGCPAMQTSGATVVELRGGHHFKGDRRRLSRVVTTLAREVDAGR